MREWTAARQHVQTLKATDPRGAERLNKEITAVSFMSLLMSYFNIVVH